MGDSPQRTQRVPEDAPNPVAVARAPSNQRTQCVPGHGRNSAPAVPAFTTLRATALPRDAPTVPSAQLIAALFAPSTYDLTLAHNCSNLACRVRDCRMCARAARKRCDLTMVTTPALDGGVLAPCGATMSIDVVLSDRQSEVVDAPPGTCVHFFLVDAAAYEAAVDHKSWVPPPGDVVPAFMTVEPTVRCSTTMYHVLSERGRRQAAAPAQSSTAAAGAGPSFAVAADTTVCPVSASTEFRGKRQRGSEWNVRPIGGGRVRLMAALVDTETGAMVPRVTPAVSKPIVVHMQPRRLVKTEFARTVDLVTVLPGIGIVASNRLVRLAHSVPNIALPPDLHCIRTVGDMKRLVERCAHDKPLDTAVRNALSLARSVWGKAKQAVVAAVEPDSRLRAFCITSPAPVAVICPCTDGIVEVTTAVAVMVAETKCGALRRLVDLEDATVDLPQLLKQAKAAWLEPGHPGWDIVTVDGRTFDNLPELRNYMAARVAGRDVTALLDAR